MGVFSLVLSLDKQRKYSNSVLYNNNFKENKGGFEPEN